LNVGSEFTIEIIGIVSPSCAIESAAAFLKPFDAASIDGDISVIGFIALYVLYIIFMIGMMGSSMGMDY
jgi:hypothetical protein